MNGKHIIKLVVMRFMYSLTCLTGRFRVNVLGTGRLRMCTNSPRILSLQSHIVHGYVGNKAATFPLQCMGFNVDAINTVHFSNHPAYPGGYKGQVLNEAEFQNIIDGLQSNDLLNYCTLISGYIRSEGLLLGITELVRKIREKNPNFVYLCDPVLGDNGSFYVPRSLLEIYRDKIIPLSTIITPNYFETEVLTGIAVNSIYDAKLACLKLHQIGVQYCLLTGLPLQGEDGPLTMVLSSNNGQIFSINVPRASKANLVGCGDLCSAVTAGWFYKLRKNTDSDNFDLGLLLDKVASTMTSVIQATADAQSRELLIIEAIDIFRSPQEISIPSTLISNKGGGVVGVIFDMDGTLTEPGAIDFDAMYTRIGLEKRHDICLVDQIESKFNAIEKNQAYEIIVEEEILACERMVLQKDLSVALATLKKNRIRCAIATRNCHLAYKQFLIRAGISDDYFNPALCRDSLNGINKPDPRVAQHILESWNCVDDDGGADRNASEVVWFVGDSDDDMACGRAAGCKTCLIVESSKHIPEVLPENVDIVVSSLTDFLASINISLVNH